MSNDDELRGGPDDQMREDFRTVAQATTASGTLRHWHAALRRLAELLTGAAPSSGRQAAVPPREGAIFELCHLANAIDAAGGAAASWMFFLGPDRVGSPSCRAFFAEQAEQGLWQRDTCAATADGVTIGFAGETFAVTYARMPVLIALFEFLASMEAGRHLPALLEILDDMVERPPGWRQIQDAANRIAGLLRGYLNDHLLSAASDEAFASISRFLQQRADGGRWRIDDDTILAFWQQENGRDFRTYEKAFRRFVELIATLATAERSRAAAQAARLGADSEQGEVDPEDLPYALDALGEWQSPFAALAEPPADEIKFFTGTEQRQLSPLASYGPDALQLPLAFLRLDVFGARQTAISQALRRKQCDGLKQLVDCGDAESYEARRDGFAVLRRHVQKLQLATLHAIRNGGHGPTATPGDVSCASAKAFRELKRQGFDAQGLQRDTRIDGFHAAADALTRIAGILDGYLDALEVLDRGDPTLTTRFQADRRVFAAEFRKIYGDAHG